MDAALRAALGWKTARRPLPSPCPPSRRSRNPLRVSFIERGEGGLTQFQQADFRAAVEAHVVEGADAGGDVEAAVVP